MSEDEIKNDEPIKRRGPLPPREDAEIIWEGDVRFRLYRRPDGTVRAKQRLCNAWENTCGQWAMSHSRKCRKHGGKVPRGAAHYNWKSGKYSKVFSKVKVADYQQYLKQRGTENIEAMAILDVLIAEDVGKLEENRQLWTEAKTKCADLRDVLRRTRTLQTVEDFNDMVTDLHTALVGLEGLLNNGETDAVARENLRKNLDLQTRIVERDARVTALNRGMYSLEQVAAMAAVTRELILKYIPAEQMIAFELEYSRTIIDQESGMVN